MKNLLICICFLLTPISHSTDLKSPINKKYQSKNPELYIIYEKTFNELNQWSGQFQILQNAYNNLIKIVETDPEFAPAYREFGRMYIMSAANGSSFDTDLLEVAKLQILKSIELEPKYADAFVLLGHLYTNLKEYGKAHEALVKAETIGTQSPWLPLNFADLYKQQHEYEKAFKEYKKAIELHSSNIKANLAATTGLKKYYEKKKDYENADLWFEKSIEFAGHSAWTFGNHASDLLYKRGDFDGAIKYVEKALEIMNYGNGRSILATALYSKWAAEMSLGNSIEAEKHFQRAHKIKPNLESMIKHAQRYKGTKNMAKALQEKLQ